MGAALFAASLAYFGFSYLVLWGDLPPEHGSYRRWNSGVAIVLNVLLFSLFALHHSVFARERVRARVTRLVTARHERAFYVWVASALFILVCALWQPVPGILWRIDGPARFVTWPLQALGAWLTLRSAAMIDVWVLAGVRPAPDSVEFRAAGPYAWVRHPIYTGWFLLVFAVATMTMTRLVFALVSSAYLLVAIPFEERSLLTSSNGAYERYAKQVRWKLFPGLY